jgi:hypothetical protein
MTKWQTWLFGAVLFLVLQHYASQETRCFAFVIQAVCLGVASILKAIEEYLE